MEQFSNTELKNFFSGLVANPNDVSAEHAPQLKTLVELYPQSGILRALLARSIQVYDQTGFQQRLKSAAVYAPDRAVLYNLINYPEKMAKYVEPLPEIYEEEEEVSLFDDDDYTNYQEDGQPADAYDAEHVYEEAPINYFHESEEVFQHAQEEPVFETDDNYDPYQAATPEPVFEPVAEQPQETPSYYNYTAPEPEAPVEAAPVPEYTEYTYTAPVYQPEPVIEQPSTYYEAPAYLEPVEEEQPEPSTFNNLSYPEPEPEVILPPIPGYYKPSFEEEMLKASVAAAQQEIDDEIFDEITGIEDIYIEPITRHRQGIPDISLEEQETAPIIDGPDELEDILMAQYGEEDNTPVITEDTISSYTQPVTEPISPPVEVKEYSFSTSNFRAQMEEVEAEDETGPESDEVDFEMVDEPVKPPARTMPIPVDPPVSKPMPLSKQLAAEPQFTADDERVSKYNDDKMPYSFMWWLDKTRKEHATTHQPYVPFKPIIQEVQRPAADDELQQQYFENIFHITSVEQLDINTRDKRKESEIIDRFIQQDPQLKPPNTEKLDNENKAKKSSEDQHELVSETLARIYLDQMLYNKAISTYQKLLLKFPEKSSYFVAQIKLLEKKIN